MSSGLIYVPASHGTIFTRPTCILSPYTLPCLYNIHSPIYSPYTGPCSCPTWYNIIYSPYTVSCSSPTWYNRPTSILSPHIYSFLYSYNIHLDLSRPLIYMQIDFPIEPHFAMNACITHTKNPPLELCISSYIS